jgi:hypothetical protein
MITSKFYFLQDSRIKTIKLLRRPMLTFGFQGPKPGQRKRHSMNIRKHKSIIGFLYSNPRFLGNLPNTSAPSAIK